MSSLSSTSVYNGHDCASLELSFSSDGKLQNVASIDVRATLILGRLPVLVPTSGSGSSFPVETSGFTGT